MKKKRIVKLEPQTVELFAEVLSKLRPPPPLTVSQWADRYRVLSAESSAEPGRWHTEKAPYQRAIMDAIGDPHVRSVVVMSAAQIGKTDAFILNPLGYYMDYAPCPVMCMQPTLDMGQTLSKDRIAPMIRDTPRLTGLVDTKSRYAGNTVMKKNFPGGHITIVGANSPSSLASRPIKVLLADEIDRYPKSAGTEGDPLDLAKKRQTTFWDYKTVMVSTPTIKGDSRIEDAYLLSTQEEWNVPCPECGAYQPFLWENVKFDKDDLDKGIGYVCRECGCVSNEYRWKEQGKYGKYVAANPGAESRGFHLNTLASTFVGWKEIVTKFIEAKIALDHGNPEQMKVWVNTELGETWEERGIQLEDIELFNRREIYAAEVPDDVLYLTAGVDVQDGTIEVAYEDRDGSVTDEICVVSNALYRMPVVGAMVCVLHNSDSQEMGTCIGTFWNEDNKPVGGKKQRYRYDYNDKKGKAFEQYDGDSGDYEEKIDGNAKETIGKNLDFTVGGDVTFKVGASTVKVCQSGTIEITGTTVKITGATVNISGGSGDCKINGVSLVNHKHEHDGSAKAGPYTVSGNTGVPVK